MKNILSIVIDGSYIRTFFQQIIQIRKTGYSYRIQEYRVIVLFFNRTIYVKLYTGQIFKIIPVYSR